MKTLRKSSDRILKSIVLLGMASTPSAFAVERPADLDDQVPTIPKESAEPVVEKNVAVIEVRPEDELRAAGAEVPYLGIGSVPISDLLAGHLGLAYGVTIQRVHEGSGADLAGLKVDDILTLFNGREIRSPLDLRDAVKACEIGQEVTVSVVRRGIKEDISVTLAKRPAGLPRSAPGANEELGRMRQVWPGGDGAADNALEQLRGMIDQFDDVGLGLRMTDLMDGQLQNGEEPMEVELDTQSSVTWADSEGDINMKMSNGGTTVTVRDRKGNVTFTGPWNTEEDKAAVEPGVRDRIENMGVSSKDNRLRFWMGPPNGR